MVGQGPFEANKSVRALGQVLGMFEAPVTDISP